MPDNPDLRSAIPLKLTCKIQHTKYENPYLEELNSQSWLFKSMEMDMACSWIRRLLLLRWKF